MFNSGKGTLFVVVIFVIIGLLCDLAVFLAR
jgi:hypothetical protein